MFDNKDFYPTPPKVIDILLRGVDIKNKNVLDPESGKGDILKACKELGAVTYGCELQSELYEASKLHARMIGFDFLTLTREDISHIEVIIMNPPFSQGVRHLKHAINIAPDGCIIRSLFNSDTLQIDRFAINLLHTKIKENNGEITELGTCFNTAERKTNVNIAMISLSLPEEVKEDWDKYFTRENLNPEHASGLMKASVVDEVVGRYVGSLKMYDEVSATNSKITELMGPINIGRITFGCIEKSSHNSYQFLDYENFKTSLQKSAWTVVFDMMKMEKHMTSKLKEKIAKFVDQQSEIPFTVENIYNMLSFIYETTAGRMDEVLIEVFESFTKYSDENRHNVEGWKTNSHYMINQKIIVPYTVERKDGGSFRLNYSGNGNKIEDLNKALCFITGTDYTKIKKLEAFISYQKIFDIEWYRKNEGYVSRIKNRYKHYSEEYNTRDIFLKKNPSFEKYLEECILIDSKNGTNYKNLEFGKWYTWGFFEIKAFKKGTMHIKFIDTKVCELFNLRVAESKGFELPDSVLSKETQSKRQENPAKELIRLELDSGAQAELF